MQIVSYCQGILKIDEHNNNNKISRLVKIGLFLRHCHREQVRTVGIKNYIFSLLSIFYGTSNAYRTHLSITRRV
jgi:hypothetical protein